MGWALVILVLFPLALGVVEGIGSAVEEATLDPQLKARREEREKERVIIKLSYKDIMENKEVNVRIGDKQYVMSEEEFEVTKQVLKNNNPERVSREKD